MATIYRGDDEFGAVYDNVDCTRCEDHGRYPCSCCDTTSHRQPIPSCPACSGTGLIDCPGGGNA